MGILVCGFQGLRAVCVVVGFGGVCWVVWFCDLGGNSLVLCGLLLADCGGVVWTLGCCTSWVRRLGWAWWWVVVLMFGWFGCDTCYLLG